MSPKEYAKFRSDDYADKFKTITKQLDNTKTQVASTSAIIQLDKDRLSLNQDLIKNSYAQKDKLQNKCMAKGAYNKTGEYVQANTKEFCNSQTGSFDKTIQSASDQIDLYTKELDKNKLLLKTYQSYADFFSAQARLTDSLKVNIPLELGLYVPEDSIKIVIDNSPRGIAEYFETVTHEYLHYASHVKSNKQLTTALFEEGITEYFAKNIIKNSLKVNTNLGYPVFAIIISKITNMIPESELADLYFVKDETGLEKALDRVYGDNFYKDNLILFETLQYTSNNKQLLKFSNTILNKMNEKPLKENDLISAP